MKSPLFSFSIVSHGQSALIRNLLDDLSQLALTDIEVIITVNIPEDESPYQNLRYPSRILRNSTPRGFGANHNVAFEESHGHFFVVVNPDIRLPELDMGRLLVTMDEPQIGAVAPAVLNSSGLLEDSVRRFPTIVGLALRVLLGKRKLDYQWHTTPIKIDWAAGMFVVFRREAFSAVGGFDHRRFFMYYEDVDICARLWRSGWSVMLQPQVKVIHDAQRASRHSMTHLRWHFASTVRYFTGL